MRSLLSAEDKQQIQLLLRDFVDTFSSQAKAAARIENCSEAVVIQILNDKWDKISDSMWVNVGNQVGWKQRKVIHIVETLAFQTIILYLTIAKEEGEFFSIVSKGGRGKTVASEFFEQTNRSNNVFNIKCETYFNKKILLQKILVQLGKKNVAGSVYELYEMIRRELLRLKEPLLIFDQVGKLADSPNKIPILLLFIALSNDLKGKCGIVWLSTEDIVKTMEKGLNRKAPGFQELSSRYGETHIELPDADKSEIKEMCRVNGITSEEEIARIYNTFGGDLRVFDRQRLKNKVLKQLSKYTKKAA